MGTLGARLEHIAPGEVRIGVSHRPDLTQQHGFLHAGAVTSVVDSACGYAALTLMEPGAAVLSVEFKVNLLAPASGKEFVAIGKVVR
ncbi:MAG: PaaI family thioesterase, partial [Gemmatimonadetes bacterium]|nr:PaaI family thioesterase [Gemmatimonadota bacterium]